MFVGTPVTDAPVSLCASDIFAHPSGFADVFDADSFPPSDPSAARKRVPVLSKRTYIPSPGHSCITAAVLCSDC